MGKQLEAVSDSQWGSLIARGTWAHLVGLLSMLLFGFTLKAIGPVHIFRLVVSAIDVHRRRV